MINGKEYDMENVNLRLLGRKIFGIVAISYGENHPVNKHYGASRFPVSFSKGQYEATGSITLLQSELETLQKSLPRGRSITSIPPFTIVVTYAMEADPTPVTDRLVGCQFTEYSKELSAGEGGMEIEMTLSVMKIEPNI
jgi:hypothetical protein